MFSCFKQSLYAALVVFTLVLLNTNAKAAPFQKTTTGLGIALGSVFGISGYYQNHTDRFLQGILSFSSDHVKVNLDYNFLVHDFLDNLHKVHAYYGIGGLVSSRVSAGVRIPLGLVWHVPNSPLQLALELGPGMIVVPETKGLLDLSVHLRFMF